ncbi:MAG: hypothetical protein H6R05_1446 [Burkholderiaceae bacterium]|nr:hypothetical protein [Burkholderiaceae bacterium]
MILKQFFLALLLTLGLLGCQTVPSVDARNTVAIDKTLVHSFHLGSNANAQPYLLVVLNDKGIQTFEATAKKGEPYNIVLDGHVYQQSAQVNTGFLVLYPAASEWTQARLVQLLK